MLRLILSEGALIVKGSAERQAPPAAGLVFGVGLRPLLWGGWATDLGGVAGVGVGLVRAGRRGGRGACARVRQGPGGRGSGGGCGGASARGGAGRVGRAGDEAGGGRGGDVVMEIYSLGDGPLSHPLPYNHFTYRFTVVHKNRSSL